MERVFSQGRLLLPYIRNRLSSESTRALLCLGDWCRRGIVKDSNIKPTALVTSLSYLGDARLPVLMFRLYLYYRTYLGLSRYLNP
jgi:hypothetical protein